MTIDLQLDDVCGGNDDPFAALNAILGGFNSEQVGPAIHVPMWIFARDASGKVQGGLRGQTYWSWATVMRANCWRIEAIRKEMWAHALCVCLLMVLMHALSVPELRAQECPSGQFRCGGGGCCPNGSLCVAGGLSRQDCTSPDDARICDRYNPSPTLKLVCPRDNVCLADKTCISRYDVRFCQNGNHCEEGKMCTKDNECVLPRDYK